MSYVCVLRIFNNRNSYQQLSFLLSVWECFIQRKVKRIDFHRNWNRFHQKLFIRFSISKWTYLCNKFKLFFNYLTSLANEKPPIFRLEYWKLRHMQFSEFTQECQSIKSSHIIFSSKKHQKFWIFLSLLLFLKIEPFALTDEPEGWIHDVKRSHWERLVLREERIVFQVNLTSVLEMFHKRTPPVNSACRILHGSILLCCIFIHLLFRSSVNANQSVNRTLNKVSVR